LDGTDRLGKAFDQSAVVGILTGSIEKPRKTGVMVMAGPTKGVIDSRRLLLFYHVARTGSLSKAEASLFIPQPAISRHLSRLEEDLGVQLLDRHGRGVTLTSYGEILYRQAELILNEMTSTIEEIDLAKRRPTGRVSISASAIVMSMFMPEIIRRFMAQYPDVEVTAIQAVSGEVYNQLVSGKVDVAIVMQVPSKHKFGLQKLLEEPMVVIASKSHPIAAQDHVRRDMLPDLEIALPASPNGMRGIIDQYFKAGHIELMPHLQLDSVPLTCRIVADGRFVTLMPQTTFDQEFGSTNFVGLPLKPAMTRTLYAARRQEEGRSPYVDALLEAVIDVFKEAADTSNGISSTPEKPKRRAKKAV
jgi:LysR family nitrogen assimilation transcriptional regulator